MKKFFCYDPNGGGMDFFDTSEEAKAAAVRGFEFEQQEAADDGWNENVHELCWGEVREAVVETARRDVNDDEDHRFDEIVECELKPVG